ncbi:UNVERIFIED_CONTAM: lap-2 [Trichonephila clavipes]
MTFEIRGPILTFMVLLQPAYMESIATQIKEITLYIKKLLNYEGRIMCRDIGGSDPERMAAPNVATYVKELFANTPVQVEVVDNSKIIEKEYPLLGAVNRAAKATKAKISQDVIRFLKTFSLQIKIQSVTRHSGCVIFLTYEPEGSYDKTVVLVGKIRLFLKEFIIFFASISLTINEALKRVNLKSVEYLFCFHIGVTYDTGGADIKAGGVMAGMHRDKCGASAVAGFLQTVAELKPKGVKVIGAMSMVRNSVGSGK